MYALKFLATLVVMAAALAVGVATRVTMDSDVLLARLAREQTAQSPAALASAIASVSQSQTSNLQPLTPDLTLLFMGDIMLSRAVADQIAAHGNDPTYPFTEIASLVSAADFSFANLEGPISSRGANQGSIYSFRADPAVVEGLTFAGFDALSLANNHIWDWGRVALEDTLVLLAEAGIAPVGAGMNYAQANEPVRLAIGDLPAGASTKAGTRLALFAFTNLMPRTLEATQTKSGMSSFEPEIIKENILNAKQEADVVVVSLHWGEEYAEAPSEEQREIARSFIDAGANLVIGHHPHVVQEVEEYRGGTIAYSLGNFVFDQNFSDETRGGLVLEVEVKNGEVVRVSEHRIFMNESYQPELVTGN